MRLQAKRGRFAKRRRSDGDALRADHAQAVAKVHLWTEKSAKAQHEGRVLDADRCKDKVRDWTSKVQQLARQQKLESNGQDSSSTPPATTLLEHPDQ
jgi:hypothetical protein